MTTPQMSVIIASTRPTRHGPAIGRWVVEELAERTDSDHSLVYLVTVGLPLLDEPEPAQARAYTLLHVFLHELGHHHDRMTSKGQKSTKRGEPYAEAFALRHFHLLFQPYFRRFGVLRP